MDFILAEVVKVDAQAEWHREQIKAALRMKFDTLLAFERAKRLPNGSVKDVLRGKASARTERAIAKALNAPLHLLFPRRYRPTKSTKVDSTPAEAVAHGQMCEAR